MPAISEKSVEFVRPGAPAVVVSIEPVMRHYEDGDTEPTGSFDVVARSTDAAARKSQRANDRAAALRTYHDWVHRFTSDGATRSVPTPDTFDLYRALGADAHRVDVEGGEAHLSVEFGAKGRATRALVQTVLQVGAPTGLRVTEAPMADVVAGIVASRPASLRSLVLQHDTAHSRAEWLPRGCDLTGLDDAAPQLETVEVRLPEVVLPPLRLPMLRRWVVWGGLTRSNVDAIFSSLLHLPALDDLVVTSAYADLPEDTEASAYFVERAEETFRRVERPMVSFWRSAERQWQRWP